MVVDSAQTGPAESSQRLIPMILERKCSAPGCEAAIKAPHICCIAHWRELPPRVQAALQERIHGWKDKDAALVFLASWYSSQGSDRKLATQ